MRSRPPTPGRGRGRYSAMGREPARRTAAYDYELPPGLIAARPPPRRDASRLLVVNRGGRSLEDAVFPRLLSELSAGDAVVINDSRVFPARLLGRKPSGARAEILLIRPVDHEAADGATDIFDRTGGWVWRAMVRPGGKLKPGRTVLVGDGLEVEILDSAPDGTRLVRLVGDGTPLELIERFGHIPLPPYIDRPDDPDDRERYQTVYARLPGSVAAPTAGLHFTPEILAGIEERGASVVRVTLHVGFGTFRPVSAELIEGHTVAPEAYRIDTGAADRLNATRDAGGRVWSVGTTTCRVLETVATAGRYRAGAGWTDLFIRPPHEFQGVDALVTNFHLPRSSLLMLVAAFAGRELMFEAYAHAIEAGYRFYSYGDAMVIM